MGLLLLISVLFAGVCAGSTVYDQRQTGKTNVRVEVKDAVIIAMADGELGGDYDYSYDYSDLTIKPPPAPSSTKPPAPSTSSPQKPLVMSSTVEDMIVATTARPKTSTSSISSMKTTSMPAINLTQSPILLEPENSSIIFPSKKPANASSDPLKLPFVTRPEQIPVYILQELLGDRPYDFLPVKNLQNTTSGHLRLKSSPINPQALPKRHCSPGFFLDSQNRCKRIVSRPLREKLYLP
ncbi:hypothetical protein RUM43_006379 [Polyplax serrata]|uniref:Uncharacterized protein n=1 Tax=Polyplax serrata TaxID=468196 RepID=A0AAN8PCK8_POLSC